MSQKTIDIHAHVIAEETMRLMQKEAPKVAPRLTAIDAESALFEVAGALPAVSARRLRSRATAQGHGGERSGDPSNFN